MIILEAPVVANTSAGIEIMKAVPEYIGAFAALFILVYCRKEIRVLLSRAEGLKVLGFELSFVSVELDKLATIHNTPISALQKGSVGRRLLATQSALNGKRVLWVDDHPDNNKNEQEILRRFGMTFTRVKTTEEAREALERNDYFLVITDMKRGSNENAGTELADAVVPNRARYLIGYVMSPQQELSRPARFFGITNRPDELMHLVCDVADRERA